MFVHYLKIIFRNLIVDKTYLAINVFGLAIGIASSLIIAQYVQFELGFDTDVRDKERIYYSYINATSPSQGTSIDLQCHPAVAPFIIEPLSDVEAVRIVPIGMETDEFTLRRRESTFYSREDNLYYADSNILQFFSIPVLKGNAKTALQEPNTAVITKALAEKFFTNENPIDKELSVQTTYGLRTFRITAVSETPSLKSSIQYNALFSFATINADQVKDNDWLSPVFRTFVKLHAGSNAATVEHKIDSLILPMRKSADAFDINEHIKLIPFIDYHFFKAQSTFEKLPVRFSGDMRLISFLIIMAGIIMIISWINYISLTNARSITRAKEVGLRKVNGASRNSVVLQFLLEFFIINLLALLVGAILGQLIFPLFATVIGSDAPWMFMKESWFWIAFLGFLFFPTLTAGFYPAFFVATYNPSHVLKGNFSTSKKGTLLRKCLVITQFAFSVCLLVSIYVIHRQLRFLQNVNLGFEKDQVLVLRTTDLDTARDRTADFQLFKTRLAENKNVKCFRNENNVTMNLKSR